MRRNYGFLALALLGAAPGAQAAVKARTVEYHLAVMQDDRLVYENRRQPTGFRVEVLDDDEGVKPEALQSGKPFVAALSGERYSVRLYNPLPVRVAVNLTVDGLNSITGKPCGVSDGEKWMIDPYGSITIPGWQVSGGEARRFFFTPKPKSYAKWRGDETGLNLSANCGVIGAAYFWNQAELDQYYEDHPIYRYIHHPRLSASRAGACDDLAAQGAPAPSAEAPENEMKKDAPEEQAGTGMGESESNPTIQVAFDYDTGMYSPDQAVVIYYDFAKVESPNPFPEDGYAPQEP